MQTIEYKCKSCGKTITRPYDIFKKNNGCCESCIPIDGSRSMPI